MLVAVGIDKYFTTIKAQPTHVVCGLALPLAVAEYRDTLHAHGSYSYSPRNSLSGRWKLCNNYDHWPFWWLYWLFVFASVTLDLVPFPIQNGIDHHCS